MQTGASVERFTIDEFFATHPEIRPGAQRVLRTLTKNSYDRLTYEDWQRRLDVLMSGAQK